MSSAPAAAARGEITESPKIRNKTSHTGTLLLYVNRAHIVQYIGKNKMSNWEFRQRVLRALKLLAMCDIAQVGNCAPPLILPQKKERKDSKMLVCMLMNEAGGGLPAGYMYLHKPFFIYILAQLNFASTKNRTLKGTHF